jgi:hypothetical protein
MDTDGNTPLGMRRYTSKVYADGTRQLHDWRLICGDLWEGRLENAEGYAAKHDGKWPPHQAKDNEH